MVSPTPFRAAAQFKSNYGPKYTAQPNFHGWGASQFKSLGLRTGAFGGAAAVAVLFYASGIPRVQRDVLQKIPFVGGFFIQEEVPASDNPF